MKLPRVFFVAYQFVRLTIRSAIAGCAWFFALSLLLFGANTSGLWEPVFWLYGVPILVFVCCMVHGSYGIWVREGQNRTRRQADKSEKDPTHSELD
jgi:hypothetical protein